MEGEGGGGASTAPARVQMVGEVLASMGVTEYDPKVNHILLEFVHKYVAEIVQDAAAFQEHANKPELDTDDVRLAIQSKVNGMFAQPPPREFMIELGRAKNSVPLPLIRPGVHLPPVEDCNAGTNYVVVAGRDAEGGLLLSPRAKAAGAKEDGGDAMQTD